MDGGDTQLIDVSSSPSRSSVSGESTGYDSRMHEPTQLLYTQLFDQYEGRMDSGHKRQHLDLDLETQLIDEHNFDDFRKNEGLIMPSEDEASKETQLIHGDEVHSGSSSGKDGEVDSALSPFSAAFSQKPSHWLSEFTRRDRTIEGVAGRASHMNFPFRDRYIGETQILSDDENGEPHNHSAKAHRNFSDARAGGSTRCPDLQNRDGDVPQFLKDFDPNRQDYAGQGTVGSWQEVTGQSEDRGWETAVRSLQLVDSDASTEDERENHTNAVSNTGLSYPGAAQLSQKVNPSFPTRVTNPFCLQDLNKSPEPEFMMDGWEEENRADLGIGRIDEGGSNVGLLNVVEQVQLGYPSQPTPMEIRSSEGSNARTTRALPLRTAGSIRAASLRASALQASSCSSSGKYRHSTPQGSKSEEVHKDERGAATFELPRDVPQKAGGSSGDTSAVSRLTMERGQSAASFHSPLSYSTKDIDSPRILKELEASKVMVFADAEVRELSKAVTSMQGEASSVLGVEVSKPAKERSPSARKLFIEDGNESEKRTKTTEDKHGGAQSKPSSERVDLRKEYDGKALPPKENPSSPAGKSLERRSSFGSGLFSTGSDMSYLSPGEDSQARALNMVDKLVWLNAIGLPQELQLEEEKAPLRGPSNAKNVLQSRVQVAEAKAGMDDPFGVFDWVDSQNDDAGSFFGAATVKPSVGRGASKALIDVGQAKQSGIGSKKDVVDAPGNRNRKADKLLEKSKLLKPIPNVDNNKGLISKNSSGGIQSKREQLQGGRSGDGSVMVVRQEHGCTEPAALDFRDSHQDGVGNVVDKHSRLPDTYLNKVGAIDNISTSNRVRLLSSLKAPPHEIRSIFTAEQAKFERSTNETGSEPSEEATQASKDSSKVLDVQKETGDGIVDKHVGEPENLHKEDRPPSTQSRSNPGPPDFHDAQGSVVTEASFGEGYRVLQGTSPQSKMEEGHLVQQDTGVKDLSNKALEKTVVQSAEMGSERMSRILDDARCSPKLQTDGSGELARKDSTEKSIVSQEQSPQNGKASNNANDLENLDGVSGLRQQSCEDDIESRGLFERGRNHYRSSKPAQDGSKLQSNVDCNQSRKASTLASVPKTDQSEGRHPSAVLSMQDASSDPGITEVVTEKTLPKGNFTAGSGEVTLKEEEMATVDTSSERFQSRKDVEVERKPRIDDEMQSAPPKKGLVTTRRGRSQTRYSARPLQKADPASSNSLISREKGRGRRVTWAGPLVEHLQRQSIGVRSPRSLRQQNEVRGEDGADSAADSSGQEEAEDLKEAPRTENVSRKRNSESLEMSTRYNDLDKIKRRFNMSDAAVARLLGTDEEEEDADLLEEAAGVKVRSLNHIQPGIDGNGEEPAVPNFKRVSKGLRSVRNRSDEGARRPWPFTSSDQRKLNAEEVVSPSDQNAVAEGNMNGTVAGDCHPSDNEFMTGRRRMRSIADVSFSNLPQTTPGRPPVARGLRRRRSRHIVISPPETVTDPSDDDLPPCAPPSISPLLGRFRGKGGPRSVRKRKEPDPDPDPMPSASEVSMSPNSSKEASPTGFKRRKRTGTISVLLSHGLNEDTIKQQKKIVAKLGGRVATSASECSHFVADKFVRTGNMLEAMASGKPVVDIGWLETCSEANRFVDEEEFVLQDAKKEEEMGFSMMSTLAGARQRPLLQGITVYITPGTSPGPDALARIVKCAGGQVVDQYVGPAPDGEQESDFCIVISSEEEYEDCIPLLEQGAKVFTPELILSGVTSYHLDFSKSNTYGVDDICGSGTHYQPEQLRKILVVVEGERMTVADVCPYNGLVKHDQLFKNFRRRRGSSSRRTV